VGRKLYSLGPINILIYNANLLIFFPVFGNWLVYQQDALNLRTVTCSHSSMIKFGPLVLIVTLGVLVVVIAINISQPEAAACERKSIIDNIVGREAQQSGAFLRIKSGLAAFDRLNDSNLSQISVDKIFSKCSTGWLYYGSAFNDKVRAPVSQHEDPMRGLTLGLAAAKEGQWVSHYAMSPETNATLFRAIITNPNNNITSSGEEKHIGVGMYVQTTIRNGLVNYVSCGSDANSHGVFWQVVSVLGSQTGGEDYRTLWRNESLNQPSTKECKLITNGDNFLEVYLDNDRVYSNSSLDLQMPPPFNSYLELTTPSADEMRYGYFKDYYEAYDTSIKLIDLPANGSLKIIGPSNQVVSNASINSEGVAKLDLVQYDFPLIARIQVFDSDGKIYASTQKELPIFGGDIFTLRV
jgi:hypothetical protein